MLKIIARQFRRPTGFLGRLVGRFMNRANARFIAGAVETLGPKPQDHVLEIGFGGGVGLRRLLSTARQGVVSGTELSDVMLAQAERLFAPAVTEGRLRLVRAAIERLPFEDAAFDGIVTVNTVYFWSDLEQGASEAFRVLKPGGRIVIGIRPPDAMRRLPLTRHGFTLYEPEELEARLSQAGFTNVHAQTHEDRQWAYICILAHRPKEPAANG